MRPSDPAGATTQRGVNVVFVEPSFPDNQKDFVRGLVEVGATVIGIGERPKDWLDDDLTAVADPL